VDAVEYQSWLYGPIQFQAPCYGRQVSLQFGVIRSDIDVLAAYGHRKMRFPPAGFALSSVFTTARYFVGVVFRAGSGDQIAWMVVVPVSVGVIDVKVLIDATMRQHIDYSMDLPGLALEL